MRHRLSSRLRFSVFWEAGRDIATQGYKYEEVEILKISEEGRPIAKPPAEEPATGEGLVETTATESMMPPEIALGDVPSSKVDSPVNPTIEVSSASTVAAEVTSYMETTPAIMISTEVTTADTSALSSNDCKNSAINFSYTVSSFFNPKSFSQKT